MSSPKNSPLHRPAVTALAALYFAAIVALLDMQTYPASPTQVLGLMLLFAGSLSASVLAWRCVQLFLPKKQSRDLFTEAIIEIETEKSAAGKSK